MIYFPFDTYWWVYAGFTIFVLLLLILDLGVFHKNPHEVSVKEASIWTAIWIGLALAFNGVFYWYARENLPSEARRLALEYLTGFVVEKSLAIDNVFVFAVVFRFFGIPAIYQHRILFFGILGALFFRGLFIAIGSYLLKYEAVIIFFGLFLIITGFKMSLTPQNMMEPERNIVIRLLKRFFRIHPKIEGPQFFVRMQGKTFITPLLMALVFIEFTDIIFAVDSVPAIFALTKEPLIVFMSNIFAILGLRSMYFMLAGVMDKFIYIKFGLASVLVFVGLKMAYLNHAFGGKFPITWSLGIITLLIGTSVVFSLVKSKKPVT